MKNSNILFLLIFFLILFSSNVFAKNDYFFPIQPMPSDVSPDVSSNIDRNENDPPIDYSALVPENPQENPENPGDNGEDNGGDAGDEMGGFSDEEIYNLLNGNITYIDTEHHRLFSAEPQNNRVLVFELNNDDTLIDDIPDHVLGQPDFVTFDPGASDSEFNMPQGIAYDSVNDLLFVADTGNNRIMIFDVSLIANGESAVNVLGQPDFTENDPGSSDSELSGPVGLVFDPDTDSLFVSDTGNNRIMIFDVSLIANGESAVNVLGQPDFTENDPGSSGSELSGPVGLVFDPDTDFLSVSDKGNRRIMVFDVYSVINGEKAANVFSQTQKSSAKEKVSEKDPEKAKGSNLFWIILSSLIVLIFIVFIVIKIIMAKD